MKASTLGRTVLLLAVAISACGDDGAEEAQPERQSILERHLASVGEAQTAVDKINDRSDPEEWLDREEEPKAEPDSPPPPAPTAARTTQTTTVKPAQPRPAPRLEPREETGRVISTEPEGSQPPPDPAEPSREVQESAGPQIPAGAEIELRMEDEVSTKTHQSGDVVWAQVAYEVLAADGMVLIAEATRVRAVVVAAMESEDDDTPAILVLDFDRIMFPEGEALIASRVMEADVKADERDSDAETAAKVAAGTAAGAILGKIFGGDKEDAIKGGAVGTAAGAAVAIGTRAGHAKLDKGARVVIRLADPVRLVS